MDQILLNIEQLTKTKTIPTVVEDEIRKYFSSIQLSEESVNFLKSQPNQQLPEHIVYCKVQIIDVLDSDVFVGAVKKIDSTSISPLGCEEPTEGQVLYFDKQTYSACVLEDKYLYKLTQPIVTLSYNFNETIKPQIFNVFNVLAIKHTFEDQTILNVIKFIEPTLYQQPNTLLQNYQELLNIINGTIQDQLISELIVLHLLSSSKYETYVEGGRQILNLYGITSENVVHLNNIMKQIYSPTLYLPLEQQYLSTVETLSTKNYDTNHIEQGILTVPTNLTTQIIIDETVLKEGQITGKILENISNIQKFVQYSKIGIDFQFSIVEIPVQTNVLILSTGRTFTETNNVIKVTSSNPQPQPIQQCFDSFIHHIHREQHSLIIGEDLKKQINQRFIELRQQKDLNIEITNLNNWILQMKILSLINQEETNYNRFEYAVQLDLQRIAKNVK